MGPTNKIKKFYEYKILNRRLIGKDLWSVQYQKWLDCYCTREEKTVSIRSERRPRISEVIRADLNP